MSASRSKVEDSYSCDNMPTGPRLVHTLKIPTWTPTTPAKLPTGPPMTTTTTTQQVETPTIVVVATPLRQQTLMRIILREITVNTRRIGLMRLCQPMDSIMCSTTSIAPHQAHNFGGIINYIQSMFTHGLESHHIIVSPTCGVSRT